MTEVMVVHNYTMKKYTFVELSKYEDKPAQILRRSPSFPTIQDAVDAARFHHPGKAIKVSGAVARKLAKAR